VLWTKDSKEQWEKTIFDSGYSVFPVCNKTIDHITGILKAKEYFKLNDRSTENVLKTIVKEPYFVYENMKADSLFEKMKNMKNHFAVVLDEYGGMCGIITITDLLEQLVGDFNIDSSQQADIEKISPETWNISGSCPIEDVEEHLGIKLPEDKYDTFNGFVIGELGEIPKDGSMLNFSTDNIDIRITEVKNHFVEHAIVQIRKECPKTSEKATADTV
jgi:putative hemolysin